MIPQNVRLIVTTEAGTFSMARIDAVASNEALFELGQALNALQVDEAVEIVRVDRRVLHG